MNESLETLLRIAGRNLGKLVIILTISIAIECLCINMSASMAREYSDRIEASSAPDYGGRPAEDLLPYYFLYLILWAVSQLSGPFISVKLSFRLFDPEDKKFTRLFIPVTLACTLAVLWILEPWFVSLVYPENIASRSFHFRVMEFVMLVNMIFMTAVVIFEMRSRKGSGKKPVIIS
jgi:hypothetical protein